MFLCCNSNIPDSSGTNFFFFMIPQKRFGQVWLNNMKVKPKPCSARECLKSKKLITFYGFKDNPEIWHIFSKILKRVVQLVRIRACHLGWAETGSSPVPTANETTELWRNPELFCLREYVPVIYSLSLRSGLNRQIASLRFLSLGR